MKQFVVDVVMGESTTTVEKFVISVLFGGVASSGVALLSGLLPIYLPLTKAIFGN